jgi:hypothetical protein
MPEPPSCQQRQGNHCSAIELLRHGSCPFSNGLRHALCNASREEVVMTIPQQPPEPELPPTPEEPGIEIPPGPGPETPPEYPDIEEPPYRAPGTQDEPVELPREM